MEIIRADNSGFCFGVKKALETTQEQIKKIRPAVSGEVYIHVDL